MLPQSSDPVLHRHPVTTGEIRSCLSWRILFPKAVTTPNESRMLCSSEPFWKKGQYFHVPLGAWLIPSADCAMHVRNWRRKTFSPVKSTLWGIYVTVTAPSLLIPQLWHFKTRSSAIKSDKITRGDCITTHSVGNKEIQSQRKLKKWKDLTRI